VLGQRAGDPHVAKETRLIRQEAVWLGEVEAPDDQAAMEKAAAELPATRLTAYGDDPPQRRNHPR
jgi:hypothetical protein